MTNNGNLEIPKLNFDANGELIITASPASSKHDFDFFEGKSKIHNRKLKSRLSNCIEWTEFESTQEMYRVLKGIGNIDNFLATFDGEPFEGMTVRLFNPKTNCGVFIGQTRMKVNWTHRLLVHLKIMLDTFSVKTLSMAKIF